MVKLNNKKIGDLAEKYALNYLKKQKMRLITCNYFTQYGEIDIIMLDEKIPAVTLVFIEVRYRHQSQYGQGFETVSVQKQGKIIRSANIFLANNPQYDEFNSRFDVVSLKSDLKYVPSSLFSRIKQYFFAPPYKLDWIQHAF